MSMLLLLSRARASDVSRSSVRLPDIVLVADLMALSHRLANSVSQYTWTPTLLPGVGDQYTLADCGAIHLGRSIVLELK